jgi:hypothetical protein
MELVNLEQLVCAGCGAEVFDVRNGFVHPDGSALTDYGDDSPVETDLAA